MPTTPLSAPVSPLLKAFTDYVPATLWNLAPKNVLMQGAGLMATGDITDLYWSGDTQLITEFPQRLGTVLHRLKLDGSRIVGECECSQPQPCQHHAASLMLVLHLLKGFSAFGHFPKRMLGDKFRDRLSKSVKLPVVSGAAAPDAVQGEGRKVMVSERHVLIRPTATSLFTFRDSFSPHAQDAFATLPHELRAFVGHWTTGRQAEKAFWEWFSHPLRRLPVYIDLEGQPRPVELGNSLGWDGAAYLDLSETGLIIRRALGHRGESYDQPFLTVGSEMVYLITEQQLIRLATLDGWQQWDRFFHVLRESAWAHHGFADHNLTSQAKGGHHSAEIPLRTFNEAELIWWGDAPEIRGQLPSLRWRGETIAQLPVAEPQGRIALQPSVVDGYMVVRVENAVGKTGFHTLTWITIDADYEMSQLTDPALLSSKGRREATCTALFASWLEPDARQRRILITELAKHPIFKSPAQGRAASAVVKKYLKAKEELLGASSLLADPEQGWLIISKALAKARILAALTRHVLGADRADRITALKQADIDPDGIMPAVAKGEEEPDHEVKERHFQYRLYVPVAEAMQRLPALVEACQQHGISLTFQRQPVQMASLSLSVAAITPEAESENSHRLDWFEVKPQVLCSGSLIPQQQWEDILAKGHYVDAGGAMQVIDLKSIDSLKRLTGVLGSQRRESRAEYEERKQKALDELVKIPRLRILDWLLLAKHGIDLTMPEPERVVLESLLAFEKLERAPLPKLKAKLRDYQIAGYSWLAFLYQHGFGGCLADDMGLGKTLQTITLLAAIREGLVKPLVAGSSPERRPHLIVMPPTLLYNWEHEIKTFCPGLPVHEYTGKGRSLIGIKDGVVLTTYELARRDIETLRDIEFDCVIFDEAQQVKNLLGERSRAMRQLQGRMKLTLTGTPLENHIGEYYSIIDLAVPGLFGDYRHFMDAMKQPNGHFNPLDRAKPFVLRRTKDKILKELPPKVESDMYLDLTESQKRFYTRAVGEVRQQVLEAFEDQGAQQAGIVALAALTRLRQVCVSPSLIDPSQTEVSPKIQHLIDKLQELREEGHCALVFSQFTRALDLLGTQLKAAALEYQRLDGSTPQQKRKGLVEAFQKPDGPGIFLISLKAGGAGLNLTRASYVFHLDPWWNPAAENQASDRAHRMGQKQTVFIQRLLMRHTVEEKIMLLKAQKRELFDRVLSGAEGEPSKGAIITKDDFKFLLE